MAGFEVTFYGRIWVTPEAWNPDLATEKIRSASCWIRRSSLLTDADRSRVHKCANCVGHFLDTSKKGTRRWCSMQLGGNRAKVAAYAARRRTA